MEQPIDRAYKVTCVRCHKELIIETDKPDVAVATAYAHGWREREIGQLCPDCLSPVDPLQSLN